MLSLLSTWTCAWSAPRETPENAQMSGGVDSSKSIREPFETETSAMLGGWNEDDGMNESWAIQIPSMPWSPANEDRNRAEMDSEEGEGPSLAAFGWQLEGSSTTSEDGQEGSTYIQPEEGRAEYVEVNSRKLSRKRCVRVKIDREVLSRHFHLSMEQAASSIVCACPDLLCLFRH
mmetsp:Transcript_41719/g.131504  ORF Transcript_41719/g.131504 Transcript_41719/m.131504 type:complete len:175 (-) Transcript_41719:942-1466(-)